MPRLRLSPLARRLHEHTKQFLLRTYRMLLTKVMRSGSMILVDLTRQTHTTSTGHTILKTTRHTSLNQKPTFLSQSSWVPQFVWDSMSTGKVVSLNTNPIHQ